MKEILSTVVILLLKLSISLGQWSVSSPDGKLRATIHLNTGVPTYSVDYLDGSTQTIVQSSHLGVNRNDCDFTWGLNFQNFSSATINENYEMVTGKRSNVQNNANELTITFSKCDVLFNIIFRAYNDGIAFRYEFPETSTNTYTIDRENSTVKISTAGKAWIQENVENTPANEKLFLEKNIGEAAPNYAGWCLPALFNPNSFWVLIAESDLDRNYFASHLHQQSPNGEYKFEKPVANDGTYYSNNANFSTPMKTPWRVIQIGNSLKNIVESTLIHNLAKPSTLSNTAWIKPAMTTWSWWSGWDSSQYPYKMKPHVDLASDWGYPYFTIDSNWDLIAETDFTDFRNYVQSKNVKLWIYYNSAGPHNGIDYFRPRDKIHTHALRMAEFQKLVNWGVAGIKVDFFQSDKQELIKLYLDILEDAASFGLMVNFHGCTIPRGWQRTYPHLMTMEGVRGNEYILIDRPAYADVSPIQNVNLAFTRNVIGSMDATPGIVSYDYHGEDIPRNSTTSHEIALVSLFESGVQHLCDYHTKYKALPAMVQNVLSKMPTTWDETKFLEGFPNDYIVLARRKGTNWYISGINAKNAERNVVINPNFMAAGQYAKQSVADGATQAELLLNESTVHSSLPISITMKPYGGFSVILNEKCLDTKYITQTFNSTVSTPFVAKNIISTSTIQPTGNIQFSAGNAILLNSGFKVESGGVFKAEIAGCL